MLKVFAQGPTGLEPVRSGQARAACKQMAAAAGHPSLARPPRALPALGEGAVGAGLGAVCAR